MNTVSNRFSVAFLLRNGKADEDGKVPIYARITVNGRRVELSVKRYIDPKN